jgi:hypothetical protein
VIHRPHYLLLVLLIASTAVLSADRGHVPGPSVTPPDGQQQTEVRRVIPVSSELDSLDILPQQTDRVVRLRVESTASSKGETFRVEVPLIQVVSWTTYRQPRGTLKASARLLLSLDRLQHKKLLRLLDCNCCSITVVMFGYKMDVAGH